MKKMKERKNKMEITVNINMPDVRILAEAISGLGKKLTVNVDHKTVVKEPENQTTPVQQTIPVQQTAPIQQTTPVQQTVPVQQTAPVQQTIPVQTETVSYTIDDLARAGAKLMDAGRQQDLLNLLAQFGVRSLPELGKEQILPFVNAMRGLGADI